MDIYDWLGLVTAALMAVFIGVVVWAYSGRRKKDFEEAANLPFSDERPAGGEPDTDRGRSE